MDRCQNLYSPDVIRSYTTKLIIGLMWSIGMRPSEPVNLLVEDIDFKNNTLHIRKTKFSKERYIPVHKSVIEQLSLHILSTYLGHVKPTDTFWYLSATPELLKISSSKYEEQFGGDDDEI